MQKAQEIVTSFDENQNINKVESSSKHNTFAEINTQNMSAKQIWGKVIVALREDGNSILHVVCGEINDVEVLDKKLIIKTKLQASFDYLTKEENYDIVCNIARNFGIEKIKISLIKQSSAQDKIAKLKKLFGEYLEIK